MPKNSHPDKKKKPNLEPTTIHHPPYTIHHSPSQKFNSKNKKQKKT